MPAACASVQSMTHLHPDMPTRPPLVPATNMQALRRTQLLALLLAATVLLSLAVPALQQEAGGSKSSKEAATEAAVDEAAAEEEAAASEQEPTTEAPFAKGAKSETSDDEDGPPVEAADADLPAKTPAKTTQPAAPAPKTAAAKTTGPPKPAKKSKIVEIAPEAEVQNEVDDIDVAGGACNDQFAVVCGSASKDYLCSSPTHPPTYPPP